MDGDLDVRAAARLVRGRNYFWQGCRPHRADKDTAADDAALFDRNGSLRLCPEHLGAAGFPCRVEPGYWRRMGRRRVDGRRGRAREAPGRGRGAALYRIAAWFV